MRIITVALNICLLFALTHRVEGQKTASVFIQFGTNDGLSSNSIQSILPDPSGYLWVGTGDGLNRFDGSQFRQYFHNPSDSTSICGNDITDLIFDSKGRLWIGTSGRGISCKLHGKDQFKNYILPNVGYSERSSNYVQQMTCSGNTLFVCCRTGTYYYNESEDQFLLLNDGFLSTPIEHLDLGGYMASDTVNQGVWLQVSGQLYFIRENGKSFYSSGNNPESWQVFDFFPRAGFCADPFGNLWFQDIDDEILYQFKVKENEIVALEIEALKDDLRFLYNGIRKISFDGNKFWFSRDNPIQLNFTEENGVDSTLFESESENGIGPGWMNDICVDHQGILWVSTAHGLFKQKASRFIEQHFTFDEMVRFAGETETGTVVITSSAVHYTSQKAWHKLPFNLGNGMICQAAWQSSLSSVELYFSDSRVFSLQLPELRLAEQKSFNSIIPVDQNMLPGFVFRESHLVLWGSNLLNGLVRHDSGSGESETWSAMSEEPYNLPMAHVNCMLQFGENDETIIGLGGTKGLYRLNHDTRSFELYCEQNKLPGDSALSDGSIVCMWTDEVKYLAVGMMGGGLGVIDLQSGKVRNYGRYDGLSGQNVTSIRQCGENLLALNTNTGIFLFHLESHKFSQVTTQTAQLGDTEFRCEYFGFEKNSTQWFFNSETCFSIDFNLPVKSSKSLKASIVSVHVFDRLLFEEAVPSEMKFRYNENFLTFHLSNFDFERPATTELSYMLEGFDPDWKMADASNLARYTNVPGGEYTFRVRIRTPGDEWEESANYKITITPPFWETWWFRIIALVTIAGIVYGVYRYRLAQILKLQNIRNKIASDLHDDIGATLSSINIFSKVAGDRLTDKPEETGKLLTRINQSTVKMMDNMSDIVWSINPQNDTLQSLILRIRAHAAEVLGSMGISVDLDNHVKEDIHLNMNARKNIFLVAKECINNIAKHSEASKATLRVNVIKNELSIHIFDNGSGKHEKSAKGGNGMKSMNRRAEELGGKLEVKAVPEQGTSIELRLPMTKIHH